MSNLNDLMKEAQKMQESMQQAQQQLSELIVVGEAGGGFVRVKMNGQYNVIRFTINPQIVKDLEMLEDLCAAAVNDAVRKIEDESRKKIADLTKNLKLPDGLLKGEEDKE